MSLARGVQKANQDEIAYYRFDLECETRGVVKMDYTCQNCGTINTIYWCRRRKFPEWYA